jgi:hypothetical protein
VYPDSAFVIASMIRSNRVAMLHWRSPKSRIECLAVVNGILLNTVLTGLSQGLDKALLSLTGCVG